MEPFHELMSAEYRILANCHQAPDSRLEQGTRRCHANLAKLAFPHFATICITAGFRADRKSPRMLGISPLGDHAD